MLKKWQKHYFVLFFSLCIFFLLGNIALGAEGVVTKHPNNTWSFVPQGEQSKTGVEFDFIRFESDGKSLKAVSVDQTLNIQDKQKLASGPAEPTYYNIWPQPSSSVAPENQVYWYNPADDMIYIAVANCVPVYPASQLAPSQIPYHQGQTAKLNGITPLAQNESLRHRLFTGPSAPSNNISVKYSYFYMYMGNAGSPHIGYVHFFPLWKLSNLNPSSLPSGYFTAYDPTGKQAYQQIRFNGGINAIQWRYIP